MGRVIASVDEWVRAIQLLYSAVSVVEGRDIWIMSPEVRARSSYVSQKPSGITDMQIADGRGQHHNVTRREVALENQSSHNHKFCCRACARQLVISETE